MILYTLGADYQPNIVIDGYSSLIWAERFYTTGDFTLTTPYVERTIEQMPLDTIVCVVGSMSLFIVENHAITKNELGAYTLTVSGRSIESIFDRREYPLPYSAKGTESLVYTPWGILYEVLNVFPDVSPPEEQFRPLIAASRFNREVGERVYTTQDGSLLGMMNSARSAGDLGVASMIQVVKDDDIGYGVEYPLAKIIMRVYDGLDHTVNQNIRNKVIFSAAIGNFNDEQYLFSKKEFKNVAVAFGPGNVTVTVYAYGADETTVGLDRRVMYVDCSNIPVLGQDGVSLNTLMIAKAKAELATKNNAILLQGKFVPQVTSNLKFNYDYGLGDRVTVLANFGVSRTMRVTEYIRSEDLNGETAYPSLIDVIEEP